jgi:hypothetical protein
MSNEPSPNPIVDDVRKIRQSICGLFGHDLERLGAELRRVEQDYDQRRGIFAAATDQAAASVMASWGDMTGPAIDGTIEGVRALREKLAAEKVAPRIRDDGGF